MNLLRGVIAQPVTVTVGVILILLSGVLALRFLPIQLTPNVEDTIVAVTTRWEGASPEEVEREIIDEQEEKLQGLANLNAMTSQSTQGQGVIRLEFAVGTDKDVALRETSDKLREVPEYPDTADEPIVEASDPDNRDYIAWIVFACEDQSFDIRTLQTFAEDRIKPVFERVAGISEVNVLGGREREAQIRIDPVLLAQRGVTVNELVAAITDANRNVSAGQLTDSKRDIRLRTVNQFDSIERAEATIIRHTASGPVFLRDVAEVVETYKEPDGFVRSKGQPVIAINAQKEVGANVMEVMDGLKAAIGRLNESGGVLATETRSRGLGAPLTLTQVYDQTVYIDDALALVRNNIWLGGGLAILVLLLFLRSIRSVGIIALAIPISIVGTVTVMVAMGRSVNVISLAGMAFAIGLVVDNAIVVLENIYRHLEMGKRPMQAAYDGGREVWGAVLAASLTTVVVFVPILLVQEEAGQLFRDIALAICAAVVLSLVASMTVIPCAAARLLKPINREEKPRGRIKRWVGRLIPDIPDLISRSIYRINGSVLARLLVVAVLTVVSLAGSYWLMPPADYLPQGNRNLIFGLLIPPPGYSLGTQETIARRIENTIRPFWEAGEISDPRDQAEAKESLPKIPVVNPWTGEAGNPIVPPPLKNYFVVSAGPMMFHGGIVTDAERVVDLMPLFQHATRADQTPGVLAFAFQVPLFQLGGSTGSAIKIDIVGDDIRVVTDAASAVFMRLMQEHGPGATQPDPSNFNIFGPEIQVSPDHRRLADLGLTPADLALATQAAGDGAIIGDYRQRGDTIDLKLLTHDAVDRQFIGAIQDTPIASPDGSIVPLGAVATFSNVTSPPQINHVGRQRSVTLQFTPTGGIPLEQAMTEVSVMLDDMRATGAIPPGIGTSLAGSASKLAAVRTALLGDGSFTSTLASSLVLALIVVYLLMCVLFQSFLQPLVIMFSVPLATLGGFLALSGMHLWTMLDRYSPVQTLDVLTMLGFVILIGVVVNNAILIVHQALNFMRGEDGEPMPPRRAISEATRTRVRPIFMSMLTSVGGMLPLVLMPGAGSELYRGLGSVVVGGLLVSTVFTIVLVPILMSLVVDAQLKVLGRKTVVAPAAASTGLVAAPTRSPE